MSGLPHPFGRDYELRGNEIVDSATERAMAGPEIPHNKAGVPIIPRRDGGGVMTDNKLREAVRLSEYWLGATDGDRFCTSMARAAKQTEAFLAALAATADGEEKYIDIVFDGPPGPESGRFVESENMAGASINAGRWIDRGNGLWALRIATADAPPAVERLIERWEREAAELFVRMNQASESGEHEKARWGDEEVRLLRLHAAELRDALATAQKEGK